MLCAVDAGPSRLRLIDRLQPAIAKPSNLESRSETFVIRRRDGISLPTWPVVMGRCRSGCDRNIVARPPICWIDNPGQLPAVLTCSAPPPPPLSAYSPGGAASRGEKLSKPPGSGWRWDVAHASDTPLHRPGSPAFQQPPQTFARARSIRANWDWAIEHWNFSAAPCCGTGDSPGPITPITEQRSTLALWQHSGLINPSALLINAGANIEPALVPAPANIPGPPTSTVLLDTMEAHVYSTAWFLLLVIGFIVFPGHHGDWVGLNSGCPGTGPYVSLADLDHQPGILRCQSRKMPTSFELSHLLI